MGGMIFLIVFLAIVLILVVIGVYGSKKSKREKVKLLNDKKQIETVAKDQHIQLYILLAQLLKKTKQEFDSIQITNKSFLEINEWTAKVLDTVKSSDELRSIYKSEDRKKEFQPIIDQLSRVRANKWYEEASFAIALVRAKVEAIKKQDKYNELVKTTEEKYSWN